MKKTILALSLSLAAVSASAAQLLEAIVIRVGDRIVTRTQYERRLRDAFKELEQTSPPEEVAKRKEELRKAFPNEVINELLVKDRADRLGIVITDSEIREATSRLKQQYGITTDEQFDDSLRKSGLTRADMEARLRDTLITNKVFSRELRNREDLTDRELRARYDREKDHYRLPERAHLREIVILLPENPGKVEEARERAHEVTAAAKKPGTDFKQLASTMSESGTKDKGGDLGEVARGELLPDLDKAVFNASSGAILGPIETRSGWHIIKVEQRLPSEVPAFESVKDRLRRDASEETFNRDMKAYMESLRKDAYIQINEGNIPSV